MKQMPGSLHSLNRRFMSCEELEDLILDDDASGAFSLDDLFYDEIALEPEDIDDDVLAGL